MSGFLPGFKLHIREALEAGVDAELVTARIAELKADKAIYEAGLAEIPVEQEDAEADQLAERLARIPDLGQQLRDASREIQRQTFEAFGLKVAFDKAAGRIEVSATVTEAVAQAFESTKALQAEGFQVTFSDIAGERSAAISDRRIAVEVGVPWPH